MPDGRVQRIDEERGRVYVIKRGRTYGAELAEVESKARVPNARVRFDLVRRHGSESATNVRLRTGSRTSRRQRRFGDLTGARRPGAKADTIASRSYGVDVTTQPFRVSSVWLQAIADQDYDGATSLYLPGSRLHTPGGDRTGRREIRAELERTDLIDVAVDEAAMRGTDRYVFAEFADRSGRHATYLAIEQGHIVEQWLDIEPTDIPEADSSSEGPAVELICRGAVPERAQTYAIERIQQAVEHLNQPCRHVRVKLTGAENPSAERPAMAEATVDLDQFLLRAHSAAATFNQAVDEVADRLAAQMESRRDRKRHRPTRQEAEPGTWRHGNLGRAPTPYFDRAVAEREIVRHKSFAADELTIDEAAWDMAMLDYDFFLFVELETGRDALIERRADGSLSVHHLDPDPAVEIPAVTEFERCGTVPPELSVSQAVDLLNETGDPLLFFCNVTSRRGNVIYRRYDGHYGLITPPTVDE